MTPANAQREAFVKDIFDRIAGRYDLLNRIISFRMDTVWRRQTIRALALSRADSKVVDLGTGTGDLALVACGVLGDRGRVFGLDVSLPMLDYAEKKRRRARRGHLLTFVSGSAAEVPFADRSFDAAMSAFVLRNVPDLRRFFTETLRVLKPGGRIATLEMFPPPKGIFASLYWIYFGRLMPWLGAALARDHRAYRYLSESVQNFISPDALAETIRETGFRDVEVKRYLRGAICVHIAARPGASKP